MTEILLKSTMDQRSEKLQESKDTNQKVDSVTNEEVLREAKNKRSPGLGNIPLRIVKIHIYIYSKENILKQFNSV
jgi:hypothetical protein